MPYMGDKIFWNEKFKERTLQLMGQDTKLEQDLTLFNGYHSVLDLGCGDGRNSIFLAKKGFMVTGIDFSEEALSRLSYFANVMGVKIPVMQADLENPRSFQNIGCYDCIIVNHYRINPLCYPIIWECLKKDGMLWMNGFRSRPADNPAIKEWDVFGKEDTRAIQEQFGHRVETSTYEMNQREYITIIAYK